MQKNQKGFTIIELIVVIAIIAVLAAIVLVNVTQYINKGKNAAIKGNMATILTNAAVWADGHTSYSGFNADVGYTLPAGAVQSANGNTAVVFAILSDNSKWCACTPLLTTSDTPANSTFCVDSNGSKKTSTTACGTACVTGTAACQ